MRDLVRLRLCYFLVCVGATLITDEKEAETFIEEYSIKQSVITNKISKISWAYATNITEYNQRRMVKNIAYLKPWYEEVSRNASQFDFNKFSNETLKRVMKGLADKGWAALSDEKYRELNEITSDMETIYNEAKICKGKDVYALEPELLEMIARGRDYDELVWIWKNWRDESGKKMRQKYLRFVELSNEAARLNGLYLPSEYVSIFSGYVDTGDDWRQDYQVDNYNFVEDIERLYLELQPFYRQLHTYVKHKLKLYYGDDKFPSTGHIPGHLLGGMWAQSWSNIESLVLPYNSSKTVNATPALQQKSIKEIFEMSDEFFTSLGLAPVTEEFWNRSMLEKPTDGREVVCHASAWDMYDGKDFRIKQCTRKNFQDFVTVHHEMGHIQYYLQYKDLLYPYKAGANPGFHEAVGFVLALCVSTPEHLKTVGLIDSYDTAIEGDINYLMSIALDKIAFLPFGKLMDDYRWSLFAGNISDKNLNAAWWSKRCNDQGVSPPVQRSEDDFDPGAKYHIPANTPFVRYFVSYILQFQFHKALCEAAGQPEPLFKCDIYRSRAAGEKLGNMLKLGKSKNWQDALETITGQRSMSAQPLLDYFKPLIDWLEEYNSKLSPDDEMWTAACPTDLPLASTVATGTCSQQTNKSSGVDVVSK